MSDGKKVVVGMSGGVDSSVAAYLLKEQGYDVIGVTMQIWQGEDELSQEEHGGCCGVSAVEDARRVAGQLGIPYYVMNFRREFKEHVMDYFAREYASCRTPNPCIACNRYVKWEALLGKSLAIGADYIATGHYARVRRLDNGRYAVCTSATAKKDQTYALYSLTQEQLAHTLMPIGEYTKEQVRDIAARIGLTVASKPDSQDICFVPDGDYANFLLESEYREMCGNSCIPGDYVDRDGNVLGQHNGLLHYTIGQRKGLGLALGHPAFVVDMKPDTRQVVVGTNEECFGDRLRANGVNWMAVEKPNAPIRALAKIRYSHEGGMCTVSMTGPDEMECVFDQPQRAITPGQAVVLYGDGKVLGGGTIC